MRYPAALLQRLADGAEHAGATLCGELAATPSLLAEQVRALEQFGVAVRACGSDGYRLDAPLALLSAPAITALLDGRAAARLDAIEVVPLAESTNSTLLARAPPAPGRYCALLAEYQSGGRGRRGRRWVAPFGASLLLSVACRYPDARADLSAVTLAVGVALLRALRAFGLADLELKWPNDVLHQGAKLAGVLCELKIEAGGPAHVVVGIGLNVQLPQATIAALALEQRRVTDVTRVNRALSGAVRVPLAARLLGELVDALDEFGRTGLSSFIDEWTAADALHFKAVSVETGGAQRLGVACGLSADGALLIDVDGRIERVEAGEVSVRVAP